MTTRLRAHEAIGFAGSLSLVPATGAANITGWTFALALARHAGAVDLTLGMAGSAEAEGFRILDGPGGRLGIRILAATLQGIADTTGRFVLRGDLMATLPGGAGQWIDRFEIAVLGDGVDDAGEAADSTGPWRVDVQGLPGENVPDAARRIFALGAVSDAAAFDYAVARTASDPDSAVGTIVAGVSAALDAKIAAAGAEADRAEAARAAALAMSLTFDSVRCQAENGEKPASQVDSGGLYLPNSNALFDDGVANHAPFFGSAGAFAVMCSVPKKQYDVMNRSDPCIACTERSSADPRSFRIAYIAGGNPNNIPNHDKFHFYATGEGANGSVSAYSAVMPGGFSGRALVVVCNLGDGTCRVDVTDLATLTVTAGPVTALPGAWTGIRQLSSNIALGINDEASFPLSYEFGPVGNSYWKGELAHFMMIDGATSDDQWAAIAAGGDIPAAIGAGNFRLWAKCASAGALDLTVSSNKAALTNGLSVRGVVLPGSTLRRQGAATYLTIDPLADPAFVSVRPGTEAGEIQLTGTFAGVGGDLEYRIFQAGRPLTGWMYLCDVPGAGTAWSAWASFPLSKSGEPYQFDVRATSADSPVAQFRSDLWVGYAVSLTGQSQLWFTLSYGVTTDGTDASPLNKRLDAGAARGAFICRRISVDGVNFRNGILRFEERAQWAGDGLIAQLNHIRSRSRAPIMIIEHAIPGTSCIDLMDDSLTGRQWADYVAVARTALANRDRQGRLILTGLVYYWATSDPATAYGAQIWRPFIFGMQSVTQGGYYIAQSHISHFLMDGVDFNPSIRLVCAPYGREATATTPQTTDRGTAADIRASQRADMAAYGFLPGPESTIFTFENGLVYGAHPNPTSELGVPTVAKVIAECVCIAIGVGTYRGRAMVAAAAFTDGSRQAVRVSFSGPPGGRLAPFTPGTTDIRGFEVQDAGAGAWTKATHTAVIETPQTVLLTKTAGAWSAGTKVSYHSGSPGGYGEDDAAWIAGSLIWDGWPIAGGNDAVAVA